MATTAQLATWITAAETRRHELAMGLSSYTEVQRNVTNRTIAELDAYISSLRQEYARQSGGGIIMLSDFSNPSVGQ